ncbi:MAG TPA: hypothetical protein VFM65_08900 [Flavobacteriaceae bacterium]|nr:hypothetical protein [Flavobacteriaceae bacterium]
MKSKLFLLSFLLVFPFVGCKVKKENKNDKTTVATKKETEKKESDSGLEGTWFLVQSSGGFAGIKAKIPHGDVKWTFNNQGSMVTVENNFQGEAMTYTIIKSGKYDYSVVNNDGKSYLFVAGKELGEFHIENDRLIIDENKMSNASGADRFIVQFER